MREYDKQPYAQEIRKACATLAPSDPLCECIVHAIAKNDSSYASKGIGVKHNNIGNIRCLHEKDNVVPTTCKASTNSNGHFAVFNSVEESITSLVDLYTRKYAGKLPDTITSVYAGHPQSSQYWKDVDACYSNK